jgi:Uma2 family endonuclease
MMSTQTQTAIPTAPPAGVHPATASGAVPYRLSVRQYLEMIDAGIFRDDDHVELLGGLLVAKMTKKDPHNFAIDMLGAILEQDLAPNWIARQEKSVVPGRFWRPEPDIAVARGPRDRYRARAPGPGDLAALIEVADSSYSIDRGKKWQKYASSRIPAYWIVNLPQRQIEVDTVPSGRGKSARYQDVTIYGEDDEVSLVIEGRELGRIKVRDVLPSIAES